MNELENIILPKVETFLSHTKCWFHPRDIWNEHNIRESEAKAVVRTALEGRVADGTLQKDGQRYRVVSTELRKINWFDATEDSYIKMGLPFNLHYYLKLFPGIVVIAGEKGLGKSAWIMDCIFRNLSTTRKQHLFINDAQDVEIKERFLGLCEHYECVLPINGEVEVLERFDKFGDVIVPDGINYVDYLDVNSDFYSIGQEIDDIHRATGNGITFIAIQKNPKEALGVGGIYSWKRAQVYITLSDPPVKLSELWQGELTLKRTRGRVNRAIDPTGRKWCYDILEGYKFSVEHDNQQKKGE